MSNWWWGKVLKQFQIISEIRSKSCHELERGQYLIFWVGWAIGYLIQYLFNFLYSFFRFIYAQFQKRQQDLNLLRRFYIPIQLFTEDWIVDWAVLAQIVEYSMHPISLKILFYANRPFKWVLLWCLFFFWQAAFFLQKSLCWERKWWGGVKDKDLTDFALIKLPPNSQFSLLSLEHGYEPFMRWSSYIVVLTMDLVFRRVRISITNHQR